MLHIRGMLVLSGLLIEATVIATLTPAHAKRICAAISCGPEIIVTLSNSKNGRWKKGTYHVAFLNERNDTICEVKFALPNPSRYRLARSSRITNGSSHPKCRMEVRRARGFPESEFIVRFYYPRRSNPNRILFVYNSRVLLERHLNLDYRVYARHGPTCPRRCRRATHTIFVPDH